MKFRQKRVLFELFLILLVGVSFSYLANFAYGREKISWSRFQISRNISSRLNRRLGSTMYELGLRQCEAFARRRYPKERTRFRRAVTNCLNRFERSGTLPSTPTPTPILPLPDVSPPPAQPVPTTPDLPPSPLPTPLPSQPVPDAVPVPVNPPVSIPPVPSSSGFSLKGIPLPEEFSRWQSNMLHFGRIHCEKLRSSSTTSADEKLAATYYDAQWVFQQIYTYTRDPYWNECANLAKFTYRDAYVIPNNGVLPGFWCFNDGLTSDFLSFGDEVSKTASLLIANNSVFARDSSPIEYTESAYYSREVAYALKLYLNAESLGAERRPKLVAYRDQALRHIDEWFVRKNAEFVRPFMVGLTAHALQSYHEQIGNDPRIFSSLKLAADKMWQELWLPDKGAFKYTDRETDSGGEEAAPDLNLLIAPLYYWLYEKSGDTSYVAKGDAIFNGGVKLAFLGNGKQFNQNYRYSIAPILKRRF